MACQLQEIFTVEEITNIRRYLFPELSANASAVTTTEPSDDWGNDDWGWKDDEDQTPESKDEDDSDTSSSGNGECNSWLQQCLVALSPADDLMAIANGYKLVLLAKKYTPGEGEVDHRFSVSWQGSLKHEEGESITSLLCLPLASQKRSTHGGPDWICVVVGFTTGYVRMYTETGILLLSQLLHEKTVQNIKCKSYEPPRHASVSEQHEELIILYPNALVTIDGFSLFQTLRACRNQVAKAAASGSEGMSPPPLEYKKWGLQDQVDSVDHITCGVVTPNAFDQMQTASILGGYTAKIKRAPPAASLYATSGTGPFVGFYHAIEGSAPPLLGDVAYAMAHKLKSAFLSAASGWLGFKPKADEKEKKPKIEPATPLPLRHGLPDKHRVGESIVLSPNNTLAATTDGYGRVLLIDVVKGRAVRMWKGYRDAQVGWIKVKEDSSRQARVALFLVIYAPRRGLLEVWTAEQGPRVAAFNVNRGCQLLYLSHSMLGLNNVSAPRAKVHKYQCCLMEPSGQITVVDVPFHFALSDKNSKRARDIHLLKKLKIALKQLSSAAADQGEPSSEPVICLLHDMKIASIRQQGLERVLSSKHLPAKYLYEVVKAVEDQLKKQDVKTLDVDSKILQQYCSGYMKLLTVYMDIERLGSKEKMETDEGTSEGKEDVTHMLQTNLSLTKSEVDNLLSQVDQYSSVVAADDSSKRHVTFTLDEMKVTQFLHCFTCPVHHRQEKDGVVYEIKLKELTDEAQLRLGSFLFKDSLNGTNDVGDTVCILKKLELAPEQLLKLCLHLWLSEETQPVQWTENLHSVVKHISELKEYDELLVEPNHTSPWWQILRSSCSTSCHIAPAFLTAYVGRAVNIQIMTLFKKGREAKALAEGMDISEWESVTLDIELWNTLISQLEDVLNLSCLLQCRGSHVDPGIINNEPINVSVSGILDGGRGVIAEYVAKWVSTRGISPDMLQLCSKPTATDAMETEDGESTAEKEEQQFMKNLLLSLQKRLPYSLDTDILMANCAWEYCVRWNKDVEVISKFENSLAYLKLIQNAVLQHGVCSMMWHMFLQKKVQAAAYLMEKVGKSPKDRLCRKEVGMSDVALTFFLGYAYEFMELLIQANCESTEVPLFSIEDLWQSLISKGSSSLAELAIDQRPTTYVVLKHHLHLVLIMHAVMVFGMKSVKPLTLFDTKGKNAFFHDLHEHPYINHNTIDEAIANARQQFASRVISQAVQSIQDSNDLDNIASAKKWCQKLLAVADDLCIDSDHLRRVFTCELYSSGLDKLAEEALLTVSDHAILGSQLLLIAGKRIAANINESYASKETTTEDSSDPWLAALSNCSPLLSTWLQSLDSSDLKQPFFGVQETAHLIGEVMRALPEGHSEFNLASELCEFIIGIAKT